MYWIIVLLHCFGTVLSVLTWHDHPYDKIIFEGQSVTFLCQLKSTGLTNGEHQHWVRLSEDSTKQTFLSDNSILSSYVDYHVRNRFSLGNNAGSGYFQLTIRQATAWDNGQYGCVIYGRTANRRAVSRLGKLTVLPRRLPAGSPVCHLIPPHPMPGSLVEFTCTSFAATVVTNITWTNGSRKRIPTHVSVSTTQRNVSFHRILEAWDNHVEYTCAERWPVSDSEIRTCSVIPFDVPINVAIRPRVQRIPIGQYASFRCVASAVPPPSQYFWYYEGYPVTDHPHIFQVNDEGKTLYITQVSGTLGYQYQVRCKAGNGFGTLRSAEAYLYVLPASASRPVLPTTRSPTTTFKNNRTRGSLSGGKHNKGSKGPIAGSTGNSTVTILLGLTCTIGAIILILLALLLIVCLRSSSRSEKAPEPVARTDSLPCKKISAPLREVSVREQDIKPTRRTAFSSSARGVRRTVRHSYQPLKKGYVRRKGSTVSLGAEIHSSTSSVYENATPLRISFPEEVVVSTDTNYANSPCEYGETVTEYANSANNGPPRKSSRTTPFGPISI